MTLVALIAVVEIIFHIAMTAVHGSLIVLVAGDTREELEIRWSRMAISTEVPASRPMRRSGCDRKVRSVIKCRRTPDNSRMARHAR